MCFITGFAVIDIKQMIQIKIAEYNTLMNVI